jgi:hypothetical protein
MGPCLRRGDGLNVWAVALLFATPLAAAVPKAASRDPAAIVADARARAAGGDCPGALAITAPLVSGAAAEGEPRRIAAQLVRLPCLAVAGRGAEVDATLAELRRTAPANPAVRAFAVSADAQAGRTAQAADGMIALADQGSPGLRLIPGVVWRVIAQRLMAAHDAPRRDRLALSLARAQWAPADDPTLGEAIAYEAAGAALDGKDTDEAAAFLSRVRRPDALAGMAIDRRYQALWPAIEKRLGPASGAAADRYARSALVAFADRPDDIAVRRDAARAFLYLGRADDLLATTAPVAVADGMDEDRVTIMLLHAQALTARGDRAGAIAVLAPVAALDPARTPQASSALISLAELYHEQGRFADELALARTTMAKAQTGLSPFGIGWLRRNEVCALVGLHRDAEAKATGDALKAAAADNQPAAIEGLLCARRDDEAAAIAMATLGTPDGADRLADQFQPAGALFLAQPSALRESWERLLARADVRAAFDRAARILPKPLWPARDRAVPVSAALAGTTTT